MYDWVVPDVVPMDSTRGRCWYKRIAAGFVIGWFVSLGAQPSTQNDPAVLLKADATLRTAWATSWLQSDDPLRVAWGAWLARVDRQKGLLPLLTQKVVEYQSRGTIPNAANASAHDALLAVLDALIELRATLPAGWTLSVDAVSGTHPLAGDDISGRRPHSGLLLALGNGQLRESSGGRGWLRWGRPRPISCAISGETYGILVPASHPRPISGDSH